MMMIRVKWPPLQLLSQHAAFEKNTETSLFKGGLLVYCLSYVTDVSMSNQDNYRPSKYTAGVKLSVLTGQPKDWVLPGA